MSYGVKIKVWGDFACFTRPEMKVDVSYDALLHRRAGIFGKRFTETSYKMVITALRTE